MEKETKVVTELWRKYQIGKNYNNSRNLYRESKENYDYFHGKQWEGLEQPRRNSENYTEPVVLNIIAPIMKYKSNVVNQHAYKIVFNPNVYNTPEELEKLRSVTKGITQFVNRMWEKSQTGKKVRNIVKDACINSEGIIYFYSKKDEIISEEIDKNNIYYGNENNSNIQEQPYIIVVFRKTVEEVKEIAKEYKELGCNNLSDEEIENIVEDSEYFEQQGADKMHDEVSPMCLIVMEFKRNRDGKIWVEGATETVKILEPQSTQCELYPFAHYIWEEEKGYSRGISEVRGLLVNQREINKTATRRAIAVKIGAFPKLVADTDYVKNPQALNQVGSTIELQGMRADDVKKVVDYLKPATMSVDAYNLQQDLIQGTRELAGAGDTVTGQIDPTQASGKAISAVLEASQQPLNEQVENYKYFLEDCGKIIFELIKVYYTEGLILYTSEQTVNNLGQTETIDKPYKITQKELEILNVDLKIDVTRTGALDRYAQETSLLELLEKGMINLEEYTEALSEDSIMPKTKLETIIKKRKEARNIINAMQQEVNAINSAMQQEMIAQGGDEYEMSQMPISGDASGQSVGANSLQQV